MLFLQLTFQGKYSQIKGTARQFSTQAGVRIRLRMDPPILDPSDPDSHFLEHF